MTKIFNVSFGPLCCFSRLVGGTDSSVPVSILCSQKTSKLTKAHGVVGALSDGEDVGRDLIPPLAAVNSHSPVGVDREPLVRVHGNTEEAGVGLKIKSFSQAMNGEALQLPVP
jgi:hypothetical protein